MNLERMAGGARPERLGTLADAMGKEERLADLRDKISALQAKIELLEDEENLLIIDLLELSAQLDEAAVDHEEVASRQAEKLRRQEEISNEKGACQLQIGLLRADMEDMEDSNRNLAETAEQRKN